MTHPVFDAIVYPWHIPVAAGLHEVLSQLVTRSEAIEHLYRRCAAELPAINTNASPNAVWVEVLNNLAIAAALDEFCEIVRSEYAANPHVVGAVDAVVNLEAITPVPMTGAPFRSR